MKKKSIFFFCLILCCSFQFPVVSAAQEEEDVPEQQNFQYEDNGKRDPLWPLVSSGGTIINYNEDFLLEDLLLEGVILGKENLAIINGQVVKEQDVIGNFTVSQIKREAVILLKGEESFTLYLKKEE